MFPPRTPFFWSACLVGCLGCARAKPGSARSRAWQGGGRLGLYYMAREPGSHSLPRVQDVVALHPAVAFSWVDDQLRLHSRFDERLVELLRLADRGAQVVFAVEDQRRRLAVLRLDDRRARIVFAAFLERIRIEEELVEPADVRREVETPPVGDAGERNGRGEAVALRHGPRGHEAPG